MNLKNRAEFRSLVLMTVVGLVLNVCVGIRVSRADDALPASASAVDLSPAVWPEGELEKYHALDGQLGGQNALATGKHGVVTGTMNASAVRAGLEAMKRGGSAMDAVLTTSLAQIVLAKGATVSFAGMLNMVYYDAQTGKFHNLNAGYNTVQNETDPLSIPARESGRTALVPGFMAGVQAAHRRFGKLPFEAIFQPAVYFAKEGFRLHGWNTWLIQRRKDVLARFPETKRVFTKENGEFYEKGDLFRQPEVATTLQRVAQDGAGYMYTGDWAKKLVAAVNEDGGKLSLADLKAYKAIWSAPLLIPYHGVDIYSTELPAHGGIQIAEALNVADEADLAQLGHYTKSPEAFFWLSQIHNLYEIGWFPPEKLAVLLGEKVPSHRRRASREHAARLWKLMEAGEFELTQTPDTLRPDHSDAVVAVDKWGNVAALCHSINAVHWGQTGIFVDGVSIPDSAAFQQQMIRDTGPGNRLPDHTEPLIIARHGKPVAAVSGVGRGIHQKTLCVLLNLIDFNQPIKPAIDTASMYAPAPVGKGQGLSTHVYKGDFSEQLLQDVKELGLDLVVEETVEKRGNCVGATIDPVTSRLEAVSTKTLNAPAMAYTEQSESDVAAPELLDGFDEYVQRVMDTWHIPGMAIGIVHDGKVISVKAYGQRDLEKKLPVTTETLFPIGSNTKAFTATGLGMLVDDGVLDLDAPLRGYLPEFRLQDELAGARATTRDLLTHRTGVPGYGNLWWGSQDWLDQHISRNDVLRALVHLEPTAGFREKYQYSNENYIVAGLLFEALDGKTWEEFIQERILEPLEMQSTHLHIRDIDPSANLARGHWDLDGEGRFSQTGFYDKETGYYGGRALGPAGTIVSSLPDMLKWLLFHIDHGKHENQQLLSAKSARELIRPQIQLPDVDPLNHIGAFYGLGFLVSADSARKKWIQHTGLLSNCTSLIGFMPADRDGVVILTNWTDGFANYSPLQALAGNLKRRFLGQKPRDNIKFFREIDVAVRENYRKKELARESKRRLDTAPSLPLAEYTGTYSHPVFKSFEVYLEDGGLKCWYHGRPGTLSHFHYDVFTAKIRFGTYLPMFRMNRFGKIDRVVISGLPASNDIVFTRSDLSQ